MMPSCECGVPSWPAGATPTRPLGPSYRLRLWRNSQSLQLTPVERLALTLNFSCNGCLRSLSSFPFHRIYIVDALFYSKFQIHPSQKFRKFRTLSSIPQRRKPNELFCSAGFSNGAASFATPNEQFVALAEIKNAAFRQGLELHIETVGPFLRVRVLNLQSKEVLGVAQGAVKVWTSGRILHLDYVRLSRSSLQAKKPIFGIGFLLGAAAIRYGYDQKCKKAELLAIKDTDVYHSKLVRYYSRMGFRSVYEVTGESLWDIPHQLIWGGVGTRMDASIEDLLRKWSPAFKNLSK